MRRCHAWRIGMLAMVGAWVSVDASPAVDPYVPAPGPTQMVFPSSPAWPGSDRVGLAVSPNGTAYLSWLEPVGGSFLALKFSTLSGPRWTLPRTVADGDDWARTSADQPRLAAQADGSLIAHWLQNRDITDDGRFYSLRVVRSTDGGSQWYDVHRGHPEGAGRWPHFLSLIPEVGNVSGVFLRPAVTSTDEPRASSARGFSAMSLEIGTYGLPSFAPLDVAPPIVEACDAVALGTTIDGPIAAFRSGSHTGDVSVVRLVGNQWTAPAPVHHDGWRPAICPDNPPTMAAAGRHVVIAWYTAAPQATVRLAFSADSGRTFNPPLVVDDAQPAGRPGVALLDDGSAMVSWMTSRDDGRGEIRLRRLAPDGRRHPPLVIASTPDSTTAGIPQLVRSGDTLVLAWRSDRVRTAIVPIEQTAVDSHSDKPTTF